MKGKNRQKYSQSIQSLLLYSVFALYGIMLFVFLLKTSDFFDANRQIHRSINLVPFHSIINYLLGEDIGQRGFSVINVFGNIALFIPLGVYLSLFKRGKKKSIIALWIFLISLSVEIIQYIFGIGASDIDDLILNTLGGLLGIAIYKGLFYFLKDENKTSVVITAVAAIIAVPVIFLLTRLKIRVR